MVPMPILQEWGLMIRFPLLLIKDEDCELREIVKPELLVSGLSKMFVNWIVDDCVLVEWI